MQKSILLMGALALAPVFMTGCSTVAYTVQEKFGIEKRDILVDRVEGVAKSQADAKDEFEDALEAFRAVVSVDGGDLETIYDDMKRGYERSDNQANATRARVASVKQVSRDLFREWEAELGEYSDAGLRRESERQLRDTQQHYEGLVDTMDAATASMDPVLSVFKDRVLYLKHNLNARSIAALSSETAELESDVARLISEMEQSISAADAFIQAMRE
jgi:PAS domain-containing protein